MDAYLLFNFMPALSFPAVLSRVRDSRALCVLLSNTQVTLHQMDYLGAHDIKKCLLRLRRIVN